MDNGIPPISALHEDEQNPSRHGDNSKLFGLRYDHVVALALSLVASTQFYTWLPPILFGEHDLRIYMCVFLAVLGPIYCVATLKSRF